MTHEHQVANVSNDIEHEYEIVYEPPLEVSPTNLILSSVSQKALATIHEVCYFRNTEENVEYKFHTLHIKKLPKKDKVQNREYQIQYSIKSIL